MSSVFFIAKRIISGKEGGGSLSSPAIRVATISMALGLTIMILALAIVIGFKREVANKVIGFGSHIQITTLDQDRYIEEHPLTISDSLMQVVNGFPNIKHLERFVNKPGVIKTENDFQGILLKGVGEEYDWTFFRNNLLEGDVLNINPDSTTTNVIMSKDIADKLHLKLHDTFTTYFIQESWRVRKYKIAGIYQTNFPEYDKLFVYADIKQIQRLNGWKSDEVSGIELLVDDYDRLDETAENVYFQMAGKPDIAGNVIFTRSIKEVNPVIFEWLSVLDLNAIVILFLMLLVAGFSMISSLLIIIIERTNMIGILKALGQTNIDIRKIFLTIALKIVAKGLLWGNLIGLSFCFIQRSFGILKLNPVDYYVSEVPIYLNFWIILLLNLGTLIVTLLMLIGPSFLIAKISPAKTIRFE
ncbi:ABC transporter permease [Bacteroidales bacterium OttesenSCG-928-I14]|nr:ABC transporter permease [Bacteroidales bacterium OttesenSCG-928-I14]